MRVLAGFQPSGKFHLGNYFGSIKPNIDMQEESEESFVMIVDLHALTTVQDPALLSENIWDAAADFLACGLDPTKVVFFQQSGVPQHTELTWILSTLCPTGLLERAVSFKDKVQQGLPSSVGLFTYPILMTADILLYDGEKVPVGKDQVQHLEIARDLALKFNNAYGETFVPPEAVVQEDVAVVPGVDGQKMSKSYDNTIPLFGDEKVIKKAIMSIETDSRDKDDPKDPDTCNVYLIHRLLLSDSEASALADEYRNGLPYGDAKKRLFESYMDYFGAMRQKRESLTDDGVREIVAAGTTKAREIAEAKMEKVRGAVGIR